MNWLNLILTACRRWQALRELRQIEKRDSGNDLGEFKRLVSVASDEFERGSLNLATETWGRARACYPDLAMRSQSAVELLIKLQRYDEADDLLKLGLKRYPGAGAQFLEGLAQVAYRRGDHDDALSRCDVLRKKYPGSLKGYSLAAASLSELGRPKEAEGMLTRAIRVSPDDTGLKIAFANLAVREKLWTVAIERWTVVHETHRHLAGAVGIASALRELGRLDEADQILQDVLYKGGNDLGVRTELARIADCKLDWSESAVRWRNVTKAFPFDNSGYTHCARSLLKAGLHDQAEQIICQGIERNPDSPELFVESAWLADRRGDEAESINRWAIVHERFPNRREGIERNAAAFHATDKKREVAASHVIAAA